jgi:hypothetical protein
MRSLREIALEIEGDWQPIKNGAAREALGCMKRMGVITEPFAADPDGHGVVGSFLAAAIGWRGPVARRVKKELREMGGHPRP